MANWSVSRRRSVECEEASPSYLSGALATSAEIKIGCKRYSRLTIAVRLRRQCISCWASIGAFLSSPELRVYDTLSRPLRSVVLRACVLDQFPEPRHLRIAGRKRTRFSNHLIDELRNAGMLLAKGGVSSVGCY